MNSNEWPLVFFTLLSQISMGILLAGLVVFLFVKNSVLAGNIELKRVVMLVALLSMGVALLLSFAHLARPAHSVFALGNLAGSHLSREILMVSVFTFTLAVAWSSIRFGFPTSVIFNYLYIAALIAGLLLIWTMARIYMIPTIPAWNHPMTMVKFYNSGILLGAAICLIIVIYVKGKGIEIHQFQKIITMLFFMLSAGVFIHLVSTIFNAPTPEGMTSGFPIPVVAGWIKIARSLCLLAGFVLVLWWFRSFSTTPLSAGSFIAYFGFVLLFLAEITGRYIFYASYYRVGV